MMTENEIEKILKKRNILSDEGMVYESPNVNSLPAQGEELKKIIKEHCILFEDDIYYYVVMNDGDLLTLQGKDLSEEQWNLATDFSVDKLKKAHYRFLSELATEEATEEVAEEVVDFSEYIQIFGDIHLQELVEVLEEVEDFTDMSEVTEYLHLFGDIQLSELIERINELEEDIKDIDSIHVPNVEMEVIK